MPGCGWWALPGGRADMATQLRRLANRAKDLLFLPPFDAYWRRRLNGKVLCLLYHRVDHPGRFPFLDRFGVPPIAPGTLLNELSFLKMKGAPLPHLL